MLAALTVLAALAAVGCGGGGGSPGGTGLTASVAASGATFPKAFYEEVVAGYRKTEPGVTMAYAGGGSGKGRQDLADMLVDWAGTDGVVKAEDKPKFKGGEFVYVPTVAGPIAVVFNLLGVDQLALSPEVIARIFQREITNWNDPAIAADNPGVKLPNRAITVAHRSDGSGTTENFTKFLVAAAAQEWALGSGATVEWPAGTQAGNGNAGVSQIVKGANGAIGYVDLSDAKAVGLRYASVKNRAGNYVKPSLESASAALAGAEVRPDLTYNPLWAEGEDSYPITAPTWIITYKTQADPAKGRAVTSFLTYLLTEGEALAPLVDYAPLPESLRQKALAQVSAIVVPEQAP
ncbi:MAG: phosphate ABC transporter substrate-binding protein PstS [Acidimicrobiales bacterium]